MHDGHLCHTVMAGVEVTLTVLAAEPMCSIMVYLCHTVMAGVEVTLTVLAAEPVCSMMVTSASQ